MLNAQKRECSIPYAAWKTRHGLLCLCFPFLPKHIFPVCSTRMHAHTHTPDHYRNTGKTGERKEVKTLSKL